MVNTIAKPPDNLTSDNKHRSKLHSCRKRLQEGEDTLESWTGPEPSLLDFCTELNGGQNITPHQPKAAHNSQPVKVAGWHKGNKQVANRSSSFGRAQFHKQAAKTCQYYYWNSHFKWLKNHSFTWNSRVPDYYEKNNSETAWMCHFGFHRTYLPVATFLDSLLQCSQI